ncbi:unnamed protein product [Schistocephalus solidus]|uniref:PLAC8 family protein n=1 Tax=Schistocephalus solidus TaxID=70667 RepID=A0A183SEY5_SCHSO|nr:unnamed protein product [Schistocephalus solidus]
MTKKSYRLPPLPNNVNKCAHDADPPVTNTVEVLIKSDEPASVSPTPSPPPDTAPPDVVVITQEPEPPMAMKQGIKADVSDVGECKPSGNLFHGTEEVASERDWHDSLCDCGKDPKHCVLTALFPCCMVCAEYGRHGECCGTPLCFLMSLLPLTVQYRAKQNIRVSHFVNIPAKSILLV